MIITKVLLQDYGVYRGRNEFDFECTAEKPIVLVGGTNGAGKTTLFESVTLCLYGISALGGRTTRKAYEKFLARKIHRYLKSSTSADHASITVQFRFFHRGREMEYSVERSWRRDDGRMAEQLEIKKRAPVGGRFGPLEDIEKSHWQAFIEDLVPKGIIRLFFFDGEKIAEMARDSAENSMIRESFRSLLGIEVVEQLRTDLQVNVTRNLTRKNKSLQEDFDRNTAEKMEIEEGTKRLQVKLAQGQSDMDALKMEIDELESRISKIGGKLASGRDDAKERLAAQKILHDTLLERMHELCSGALPFSMVPAELEALANQMEEDETVQQQVMGRQMASSILRDLLERVEKPEAWSGSGLDAAQAEKAARHISPLLKDGIGGEPVGEAILGFSAAQASRIRDVISQSNTTALETLKKCTKELVAVSEDVTRLERSIASAPDDDEIGTLVSEIGRKHSEEGALRAEMDGIEGKISSNTSMARHLDTRLRDIISQIYKTEKAQQHVELTQKIQGVLDEFVEELKAKKIHLLEEYLLDAMDVLLHKKSLIGEARVSPETFEVTLFRKNGDLFPKELLSEGEKQMFAMSVLWALAKTSGRPLPFMIDTPLARLDEEHRANIVREFLPTASHQILVFSTDKEIEAAEYGRLEPYLARSYAMEYMDGEGATKMHEGYFWNKKGERVVAV